MPEPGFTFANLTVNYSADSLKDSGGNSVPGITGTYSFWAIENIFYYVPAKKVLGGHFFTMVALNLANGSLTADLGTPPAFSANRHLDTAREPGLEFQARRCLGGLRIHGTHGEIFSRS